MDSSDSRKRPLDGDSDSGVTKRSNPGSVASDYDAVNTEPPPPGHINETVQIKVLIPSIAAGAIIGKGGETITQIQKESGASVKMSKNNDFYPGTSERVCLVSGSPESVRHVNNFIMEKIREKPDPNPKPHDGEGKVNFERHKQMKVLVPNSTAGMVIGKGGAFIRQIKDDSGAYVQVSQKSKDMSLTERCVTIAGDTDQNNAAMEMILQKIIEDPQSGSCPNISYADVKGPVASSNPTGSPFANGRDGFGNPVGPNPNVFGNIGSSMNNLNLNAGGNVQQQQQQQHQQQQGQYPRSVSTPSLENLKSTLRNSGYSEQATEEISSALFTLANYGFLGLGLGLAGLGLGLGVQGMQGGQHPQGGPPGNLTLANLAGILGGGSGHNHGSAGNQPGNHGNMNASGGGSLLTNSASQPPPPPPTNGAGDGNPSVFGPVGSTTTTMAGVESSQGGSSYFVGGADHMGSGNNYSGGESMFGNQYSGNNTGFGSGSSSGGDAGFSGTNQNSFGLGTGMGFSNTSPPGESTMVEGVEDGEGDGSGISKKELQVGEHIVGAILGPGGRGIVDLQKSTSTNIQISKKGVYAPGTRNRIVTVTGTSGAVQHAQYLIQQRIIEEENKRARQNQVQPTVVRPRPSPGSSSSL